jgi:hypothetical protein
MSLLLRQHTIFIHRRASSDRWHLSAENRGRTHPGAIELAARRADEGNCAFEVYRHEATSDHGVDPHVGAWSPELAPTPLIGRLSRPSPQSSRRAYHLFMRWLLVPKQSLTVPENDRFWAATHLGDLARGRRRWHECQKLSQKQCPINCSCACVLIHRTHDDVGGGDPCGGCVGEEVNIDYLRTPHISQFRVTRFLHY